MIGRNDPCPCRSGKKYKKCCALNNMNTVEELVDKELERIIANAYEQMSSPFYAAEFNRTEKEWRGKLNKIWEPQDISEAAAEYFLFIHRADIWQQTIQQHVKRSPRRQVTSIIEKWRHPFVLLAKLTGEQNGCLVAEELAGDETYYIEKQDHMPDVDSDKTMIVIGIVLPDDRKIENGVYIISSILFVKDANGQNVQAVVDYVEKSGIENQKEIYKMCLADIYQLLLSPLAVQKEDLLSKDLTELQREAISYLFEHMPAEVQTESTRKSLRILLISYFIIAKPVFRKPSMLAAAAFQVGVDLQIVEGGQYTQASIAQLFGVSVGSMRKHADAMHVFLEDRVKKQPQKAPSVVS